jgi:hypothetical protein
MKLEFTLVGNRSYLGKAVVSMSALISIGSMTCKIQIADIHPA